MSKYNAQAVYAAFAKPKPVVSNEDNDLVVNINAEHEGDKGGDQPADVVAPVGAEEVATVETEETPVVEEVVEVAPVVEDTSGTPEAAELDVNDASDAAAETEEQIEDISEAAEGLEGIALQLAQLSVEGLEVSPFTAQMLNDHYDFVVRKFPALKAQDHRIASLEAWSVSQEDANTVSLEKVMDGIKNAGAATVKYLKELLQQFLAFLGNAISASAVMKRKATDLQTKAKTSKNDPVEVAVPQLLTTGEGFDAGSIKKLADLLHAVGTISYEKLVDQASDEAVDLGGLLNSVKDHAGKEFIGGFKIEVEGYRPVLTAVEGKADVKVKLSATEAAGIATAVVGLAGAIEAYKKGESVRKSVNAKLAEKANSEDPKVASNVRRKITVYTQALAFERRLLNKVIAVGNAANNVVAGSLKGPASERGLAVAK